MTELAEALCYKPGGRGFDSLKPYCGPGVDSASNINEYLVLLAGKGGRCVGLATLPPSCDDCLQILRASNCWRPQDLARPVQGLI